MQCLVVGIVLLIPLLHPDNLRLPDPLQPHLIRTWITQPPLPPQHMAARTSAIAAPAAPRIFVYTPPAHSTAAPQNIEIPTGEPELSAWAGPSTGQFGPSLTTTVALPPVAPAQRPVASPSPKPVASGPLKVSEGVAAAKLIYGPSPIYPRIAVTARSQGIVVLEAVIATDGSIRNLRVVSGPPLLVNAAVEAVRQWRYHPTLLNGIAVEVLTEIDVNFSLSK